MKSKTEMYFGVIQKHWKIDLTVWELNVDWLIALHSFLIWMLTQTILSKNFKSTSTWKMRCLISVNSQALRKICDLELHKSPDWLWNLCIKTHFQSPQNLYCQTVLLQLWDSFFFLFFFHLYLVIFWECDAHNTVSMGSSYEEAKHQILMPGKKMQNTGVLGLLYISHHIEQFV